MELIDYTINLIKAIELKATLLCSLERINKMAKLARLYNYFSAKKL